MDEVVLEMTRQRQAEVEASAREAEDCFRAMAAELSHRVNKAVAIIGSVVRHSLRTTDSLRKLSAPWRVGFRRWCEPMTS